MPSRARSLHRRLKNRSSSLATATRREGRLQTPTSGEKRVPTAPPVSWADDCCVLLISGLRGERARTRVSARDPTLQRLFLGRHDTTTSDKSEPSD